MNLIGLKTISYFLKFSYFFNEKKKKKKTGNNEYTKII